MVGWRAPLAEGTARLPPRVGIDGEGESLRREEPLQVLRHALLRDGHDADPIALEPRGHAIQGGELVERRTAVAGPESGERHSPPPPPSGAHEAPPPPLPPGGRPPRAAGCGREGAAADP